MDQPILSLIQIFQKMLETGIKHKLLMEINKESWRGNLDQTVISFEELRK